MKGHGKVFTAVALLALAGFALGCGGSDSKSGSHEIWFMGSIFDGANGQALQGYEISLVYGPKTVKGTVDANGRYTLGPLEAWNDYGILISLGGYRAFSSYNAGIAPPAPPVVATSTGGTTQTTTVNADIYNSNTTQTFDFDAYLYPDTLQAAPLTINIVKPDATAEPASGSIRLRPISAPSIQDSLGSVGAQVWSNDQDMLAAIYSDVFSNGSLTIDAATGMLVYGVTYQVTVYGVDGFQPASTTVRAGAQESALLTLVPVVTAPLMLTSSTISQCKVYGTPISAPTVAQISFFFNAPMLMDAVTTNGGSPELLDNGLTASTTMFATLKGSVSTSMQERGTTFNLNGSTLSIAWSPSAGLQNPLAGDTITSVTYSNLASIRLQAMGHPESAQPLSTLIGMASITCN